MKNWVKWSTPITPRVVLLRLCPIGSLSRYEQNPPQWNCHRRHFIEVIKVARWRKINMRAPLQIAEPWRDGIFDKATLEERWLSTNKEVSGHSSDHVRLWGRGEKVGCRVERGPDMSEHVRVAGKNQYDVVATDRPAVVRRYIRQGDLGERMVFYNKSY